MTYVFLYRLVLSIYLQVTKIPIPPKKTYRHVTLTTFERVTNRVGRESADAEIAQFYLAIRVEQYIRRLDITMYELEVFHVGKRTQHRMGHQCHKCLGQFDF